MFIIPMAGLSSRFFKAGYTKPKYQLDLNGETVFSWSVRSFERYFKTDKFVFIYRDVYDTKQFLKKAVVELGLLDYELVCLPEEIKELTRSIVMKKFIFLILIHV